MKKLILSIILSLSGCATIQVVDKASIIEDNNAKQFNTTQGISNIYVYRNELFGGIVAIPIEIDGIIIGKTNLKTYFKIELTPGTHTIKSSDSVIVLNTKENQNYFIWQEMKMGFLSLGSSKLHKVSAKKGRKGVLESELIKNIILK